MARAYRAGESIEDFCRACKTDRIHTVVAADSDGRPIRVHCDFCRSEHNYRGGPRISTGESVVTITPGAGPSERRPTSRHDTNVRGNVFPTVSDRERISPPMPSDATGDLEMLLRRIIREESGLSAVAPAEKWRGGTFVLRPGTPGLQEKSWPIETFFHKVVMLRNRLRTLEQQVNASDLPDDAKVKLQTYITGCYGSLTSFNVLFADENDHFKGAGGE
jgi:hypothetical protein